MRFWAILAAMSLLGSCWWSGPAFYRRDASAAGPFLPGRFRLKITKEKTVEGRIERLADGRYRAVGWPKNKDDSQENGDDDAVYTPLEYPGRKLWIMQTGTDQADAGYGLIEQQGATFLLAPLLDCEGSKAIVLAAGGAVEGTKDSTGGVTCKFATRPSLEKALIAYAAAYPTLNTKITLIRIGD